MPCNVIAYEGLTKRRTLKMGDTKADYSVFVSNVLDTMGYSCGTIRQRRQMASDRSDSDYSSDDDYKGIVSGSKGEGLSSIFESDIDMIFEVNGVICTNDFSKYANRSHMTVMHAIEDPAAPGYTFLKPTPSAYSVRFDDCSPACDNFCLPNIVQKTRCRYDDSDNETILPTEGPSLPVNAGICIGDAVCAFKCDVPGIIGRFMARRRKLNQPSKEVLEEAAKLDCHVVAVGSKCGDRPDLEWRISYTMAEMHLLGSLNETQTKLYVLLKLLAKSIFDGLKSVSSYTLKNIVLWMSELYPKDIFRPDLLVARLLDALKLLRHCVRHRYLPNYMIPERNLFSGRLKQPEYIKLLHQLSAMIEEGGNVLLMCPRLKEAMVTMYESPAKAHRLGNIRDTVEQWFLEWKGVADLDDEIGSWVKKVCREDIDNYRQNNIGLDTVVDKVFYKVKEEFYDKTPPQCFLA